jgi:predicted XRE-type DNA-binding protein
MKCGVVHAFQKIEAGRQGTETQDQPDQGGGRLNRLKKMDVMKKEKMDVVRGSGHLFRDPGRENTDVEQFKAILASEIIKALDRERLTVRAAHDRTGIAAADFSRIRHADLGRFTVDRLMSIINRLGSRVEVKIKVRRLETAADEVTA